MNTTYSTVSFNINIIRAAVEQYLDKHGQLGNLRVVHTHISPDDFTAQGHANAENDGVIIEVGRIARKLEQERQDRYARQAALREKLEAGLLTEEEWEREFIFSF